MNKSNDQFVHDLASSINLFTTNYILPSLCLIGIQINLFFSILTTNKLRTVDGSLTNSIRSRFPIFKYFVLHSYAVLIYLLICFVHLTLRSIYSFKSRIDTFYLFKLFEIYVYQYFSSVLSLFIMNLEIMILLKRLSIIGTYRIMNRFKLSMLISFLLCIIIMMPMLFALDINRSQNSQMSTNGSEVVYYSIYLNQIGRSTFIKLFTIAFLSIRGFAVPVAYFLISVCLYSKFYSKLNRLRMQSTKKDSLSLSECNLNWFLMLSMIFFLLDQYIFTIYFYIVFSKRWDTVQSGHRIFISII